MWFRAMWYVTAQKTGASALGMQRILGLGSYRTDANRGVGMAYFFLARGAHRVSEPNSDDLEEQEPLLLTRAQIKVALVAGEFKVLPWMAIVALALQTTED